MRAISPELPDSYMRFAHALSHALRLTGIQVMCCSRCKREWDGYRIGETTCCRYCGSPELRMKDLASVFRA